jgi:hypothetical protein
MSDNQRMDALEARIAELEARTVGLIRLGPREPAALEARRVERMVEQVCAKFDESKKADIPPTDFGARVLVNGDPVPEDDSHKQLKVDGQQRDYVVLSSGERSKGFVRPYRDAYRHLKCGKITTMSRAIAETYAREPHFYSGTFCTTCCGHFPIGEDGEFVWYEMDGSTGPKVGT